MAITCTTTGLLGISGKTREMSERDLWAIIASAWYAMNNAADPTAAQLVSDSVCTCTTDDRTLLIMLANLSYQTAYDLSKTTSTIDGLIDCSQCLDAQTLKAAALKQFCTYAAAIR